MPYEESFGIIPLKKEKGEWFVFLVQHHAGHWGFPKGHAENKEVPKETAKRELFEETGLHVIKFLCETPVEETYFFTFEGERIKKKVFYFIAEVSGDIRLQKNEIAAGKWTLLSQATDEISFFQAKKVCEKAQHFIYNNL